MPSLLLLAALSQQPGGDWSRLQTWNGHGQGSRLGTALADIGDVNDDGFHDLAVGAPQGDPAYGTFGRGHVLIFDGFDGRLLLQLRGAQDGDGFGASVAGVGDLDGDGAGDLLVGARLWENGFVQLYSGRDGSLLQHFPARPDEHGFGWALSRAGDLDGDGTPDFWVAARGTTVNGMTSAGRAIAYSGDDFVILLRIDGTRPFQFVGRNLAGGEDADGDLVPDVLVQDNGAGAGSIALHSGAGGGELRRHDGEVGRHVSLGHAAAFIGDVDLDGASDYLLGDQFHQPSGPLQVGAAWLHSGASGALLWQQYGRENDDRFGCAFAGLGDVNGDHTPDFAVGACRAQGGLPNQTGLVMVHSGADFMALQALPGGDPAAGGSREFGLAIAGLHDGRGDVAVGAPGSGPAPGDEFGRVHLYGFSPWIAASSATLSAVNGGLWGVTLDFPSEHAGRRYWLLPSPVLPDDDRDEEWISWLGAPLPIADSRLGRDMIRSQPGVWYEAHGRLDAQGRARVGIVVLPGGAAAYVGSSVRFAAVLGPEAGLPPLSSAAVTLRIVP
jgi:hypothetical protein